MRLFRRGPKYGNRKVQVGGQVFDSTAEARVYLELSARQRAGEIRDLATQVRFPLLVNGLRVCSWVADFTYVDWPSGEFHAVDVKSAFTRTLPVYRLKAKLFQACMGFAIEERT